ncbi:MAG: hypothetical protein ACK5LR_02820 [Mangrovibacterium sp.]
MKKLIVAAAAIVLTLGVQAQESGQVNMTSKRGVYILPQAGDFAISVDAAPFFQWFGNSFNGSTSNDAPSFADKWYVEGKYMLTDNKALRAGLGVNVFSNKYTGAPYDNPDGKEVSNVNTYGLNHIELNAGLEYRRGAGRVQGFYGYQALVGIGGTTLDGGDGSSKITGETGEDSATYWEQKVSSFAFGAGAFAGVEYFFAPKMSIGGELGLNLIYSSYKNSSTTGSTDSDGDSFSHFGIGTAYNGAIKLSFYF